jgi:hypothetical protein
VKSPTTLLVAVLAAVVIAVGVLAFTEYRELVVLRAQLADNNAAALAKKLAAAQKTIRDLENRLAAMRGRGMRAEDVAGEGADNAGANGRGRPGGRWGAFAAMASDPQFQKLIAIQMKGRISQTYGALFKSLNLSPDQLAQFQGLLADKQQALMDVMQAAREQGINPRTDPSGFATLANQAIAQTDQQIQQVLGDAGFQQYQQYQQTLPERNVINSLQQQLSYSQTPLTDDEANQMISLLAQTQPQRAGNGTSGTTNGGDGGPGIMSLVNGGGNARVTDDAIAQAQGVLSAPQVSALQQIQLQQQAQQQIQQLMRSANQGNGGGSPSQGTPSAPGSGATTGGGRG